MNLILRAGAMGVELFCVLCGTLALVGTKDSSYSVRFRGTVEPTNALFSYAVLAVLIALLACAMLLADIGLACLTRRFRWLYAFGPKGCVHLFMGFLCFGLGDVVGLMAFIFCTLSAAILICLGHETFVDESATAPERAAKAARTGRGTGTSASAAPASGKAASPTAAAVADEGLVTGSDSVDELERAVGVRK